MHSPTQRIGVKGEKLAYEYLKKQGLRLVTKNFWSVIGEIDLIMRDKSTLIFFEVRYRAYDSYGTPQETINNEKQRRITRCAEYYLLRHPTVHHTRFDVIAVHTHCEVTQIHWIKDAFQVE